MSRIDISIQVPEEALKGFAQLFVVSYDDTFGQDTDNVVHIVKNGGASEMNREAGI